MIFITGATGLLGSHLLFDLVQQNEAIRALYRDEQRLDKVRQLFEYYQPTYGKQLFDKIEWIKGDILDVVGLEDAIQGCSQVYHAAALVSFRRRDFTKLMKINREGTSNIVNVCLKAGINKLAYVSSTAALGGKEGTLTTEKNIWQQGSKTTGYAISKYSAEKEVWRGVEEGLDVVIVNPSVLFGAGSWNESSLTIFRSLKKGLKFYTPGQNAFVDARDVSKTLIQLMESSIKNERFLVFAQNVPFQQIFEKIAKEMHVKAPFISTPKWVMALAWRLDSLISVFTRKPASITKETANSAFTTMEYSNEKITSCLNVAFHSLEDTIANTIKGRLD